MRRYLLSSLFAMGCVTTSQPKLSSEEAFGPARAALVQATPMDEAVASFMLEAQVLREQTANGAAMPGALVGLWARLLEQVDLAVQHKQLNPVQATRIRLHLEEALVADGAAFGDVDLLTAERAQRAVRRLAEIGPRAQQVKRIVLDWPIFPVQVTSAFGTRLHPILAAVKQHDGVDLLASLRQPIATAGPGVVVFSGHDSTHGNFVEVRHDAHVTTSYSHLDRVLVEEGTELKAGALVGLAGDTGRATGVHLHFEVRIDGLAIDPTHFLPMVGEGLASAAPGAER